MASSLADSDSKPKLETVAEKVKLKRTLSSTTIFVASFYILQTEDHVQLNGFQLLPSTGA